jgi:branched-chain amino acid transport system ATP-binding protein
VLEVRDLKAGYGQVQVLHGLDFSVDEGEVVVILGANGAGKTTTLRAVSGMIPPPGQVTLTARRSPASDRGVRAPRGGHVPQGRGTFPELTVEENLRIGAYVAQRRGRRRHRAVVRGYPVLARAS